MRKSGQMIKYNLKKILIEEEPSWKEADYVKQNQAPEKMTREPEDWSYQGPEIDPENLEIQLSQMSNKDLRNFFISPRVQGDVTMIPGSEGREQGPYAKAAFKELTKRQQISHGLRGVKR